MPPRPAASTVRRLPVPGGAGAQDDGVHLVTAQGGERFGLVVWGWDSFVSYGYPAGSNVERINVP